MYKLLFTLSTILLLTITGSAQSFSHGAGGAYTLFLGGGTTIGAYGVTYAPRYNVVEMNDNMSVSVGTKLTLGMSGTINSRTGSDDFFFMVDVPVLAGLNFGAGATEDNDASFGAFVNAGFGMNYVTIGDGANTAIGPVVLGGVRFNVRGRLIGLSGSFMPGITKKNKSKVVGIRGVYYF